MHINEKEGRKMDGKKIKEPCRDVKKKGKRFHHITWT